VAEGVEPGCPDGPRRGGAESTSAGSSLGSSVLELCLGKEGAETCMVLENMSRFQTYWFLHLLLHRRCHATVPEPFLYLARRFFSWPGSAAPSQPPQTRYSSCQQAPPKRPLPSSPPSRGQSSGGALWRAVYAPGDGQTSPAYSSQSVQCWYLNHLLSVNKLL
jgi:hypothetical protein